MPEKHGLRSPDATGKRENQEGKGQGGHEMLLISFPEIEQRKDTEMDGKNCQKGFEPEKRHD